MYACYKCLLEGLRRNCQINRQRYFIYIMCLHRVRNARADGNKEKTRKSNSKRKKKTVKEKRKKGE